MSKTSFRFGILQQNLANVNVPNYKRRDVDFSIQLDEATSKLGRFTMGGGDADGVVEDTGSRRVDGNSVDMEGETVAVAETEARYQMLTEMTNRYFNGLKNVIREGR